MSTERTEYENKWNAMYARWDTPVEGRPLHEQIRLWQSGDETANAALDRFTEGNPENYRMAMDVLGMINQGPYFPGNRRDFSKLPQGMACTMCPAFASVIDQQTNTMTVSCEWSTSTQRVRMQIDPTKEGGAVEVEGDCKTNFGITKA